MTPYPVSIESFLRSGCFGPVELGMRRDELEALMGMPEAWSGRGRSPVYYKAEIWCWGNLEFYLPTERGRPTAQDQLRMVFTDYVSPIRGGDGFVIDPWVLNGELTLEQAICALNAAEIAHREDNVAVGDYIRLRVGCGVVLTFAQRDGPSYEPEGPVVFQCLAYSKPRRTS